MSPPFLSYSYCFSLGLSCLGLWLICCCYSLLTVRLCHYSLQILSLNDLSKKQIWTCHSPIMASPYLPDKNLSSLPEPSKLRNISPALPLSMSFPDFTLQSHFRHSLDTTVCQLLSYSFVTLGNKTEIFPSGVYMEGGGCCQETTSIINSTFYRILDFR